MPNVPTVPIAPIDLDLTGAIGTIDTMGTGSGGLSSDHGVKPRRFATAGGVNILTD